MRLNLGVKELRKDLAKGRLASAEGRLPSYRELAGRYGCSVGTVKGVVDELSECGVLVALHGKGTYLASAGLAPRRKRVKVVGVIVLETHWRELVEEAKEDLLARGWFLSVYNASHDMQSPEKEREFLLRAQEEGFASVVLAATPIHPVNTDLFTRLRLEGIKIAHFSPYIDNMEGETYFLADHQMAGRLAVSLAVARGYRQVAHVVPAHRPPFSSLAQKGIVEMAGGLNVEMLPDIAVECGDPLGRTWEDVQIAQIVKASGKYGKGVAVLFSSYSWARGFRDAVSEKVKRAMPGVLSLDSPPRAASAETDVSFLRFDYAAQTKAALDYAADMSGVPTRKVQMRFPPNLVDHGTF